MRPIELTMNAFGPFKEKVTLDFTRFNQQNTFLVSGPTGSGKTTIFDAISYALYGEASGEMREADGFKSTHATDEDLCYVDFTFEVRGKLYRIYRAPSQRAPGKTGKPRNYDNTTVNLEYDEDKVLSKVGEVESKIISLLGMNREQFHQIVLLPQGEFRKMLDSSSKEKTKIFRDIFQTHALERFQDKLKEKKKDIEKDYESNEKLLEQMINRIDAEEDTALEEALATQEISEIQIELKEALNKEKRHHQEKEEALETLIKDEKEIENIVRELTEKTRLEEEAHELKEAEEGVAAKNTAMSRDKIAQELQKEEKRYQEALDAEKESKDRLATNEQELEKTVSDINRSQQAYEKLQKEHDKLPGYRKKITETEEELRNKKNLQETEVEHDNLCNENKVQVELKQKLKEDIKINKEKEQGILEKEKHLEILAQEKDAKDKVYSEQEERVTYLEDRVKKFKDWNKVAATHQATVAEYEEKEKKHQKEDETYRHLFKQYKRNAAGLLASDLTKTEACPVCGSYDHPDLAVLSEHDISEEKVSLQEDKRQEAYQDFIEVGSFLEQKHQEIRAFSQELEVDKKDLEKETEHAQENYEEGQKTLSILKKESDKLAKKLSKKDEIIKEKTVCQDEKGKLQVKLAKKTTLIEENKKKQEELKNKIVRLREKTGQEKIERLEKIIHETEEKISEIERDYKIEEEKWQELATVKASLETAVKAGQEDVARQAAWVSTRKKTWEKMLSESSLESDYIKYLLDKDTAARFGKEVKEYQNKKVINANSLEKITKALNEREGFQDKIVYEEKLTILSERKTELSDEKQNIATRLVQYQKSLEEIKHFSKRDQVLQEKYGRYEELSRLANGSSKETNYISFERYVLGVYFDDILRAANLRFEQMSNHRYQLHRKKEAGKGGGAKGLDLEVLDQQTGKKRDVSTLSGGESFEASLSLAMGMSDVLQSQQGGVSVDTLFIDEGFGTLDSEALDNAIEVLIDLNGEGRLIGIISHVEELKTRIPSQIEVEKKKEGSYARIVT